MADSPISASSDLAAAAGRPSRPRSLEATVTPPASTIAAYVTFFE